MIKQLIRWISGGELKEKTKELVTVTNELENLRAIRKETSNIIHRQNAEIGRLADRLHAERAIEQSGFAPVTAVAKSRAGNVKMWREGNFICVIVHWDQAAGVDPKAFLPTIFELDTTIPIKHSVETCGAARYILYKLPVKNFDDSESADQSVHDHKTYTIQGKPIERARPFYIPVYRANGFFKRDGNWCRVFVFQEELGARKIEPRHLLPSGIGIEYDDTRKFTQLPGSSLVDNPVIEFRIPVTERLEPKPDLLPLKQLLIDA